MFFKSHGVTTFETSKDSSLGAWSRGSSRPRPWRITWFRPLWVCPKPLNGGNNASNRDQCHILRSRLGDARWCFFWLATLPAGSCWHHGPRGWQTAGCGEHGQDSNAGDERQHCAYFRRIRMVGEIYSVRRSGIWKILLGFCGYIFFKPPMYMFICT